MNPIFTTKLPEKDQYFRLFETTGWNKEYKLNNQQIFETLVNSWYTISAYNDDKLIGFGRIISDGIMHALILDMIVQPEYKRKGIGSAILERLKNECIKHSICDIQLFSARGKAEFYSKHGFTIRPEGSPGMEIKLNKTL